MIDFFKKTLAIPLALTLAACGSSVPDIVDFKKGDVVAWTMPNEDKHKRSSEQDCEKVFKDKSGLIQVYQNDGNNQINRMLWGGATTQSEKDGHPMDPVRGSKIIRVIESSNLVNNVLTQIATGSDGTKIKYIFSQTKNDKNQLRLDGW